MGRSIHLIGIEGVGMSGLAKLLAARGDSVSGSDQRPTEWKEGVLDPEMVVVRSSAIPDTHEEWVRAKELGCTCLHRSELLQQLAEEKVSYAVTGTHGKTTTASLLAWVLHWAKRDPSFAIGGIVKGFETNGYRGSGREFVFEADESDKTLINYRPQGAIITNLDGDHLPVEELEKVLCTFVESVEHHDLLVWCAEDPKLRALNLPGVPYTRGRIDLPLPGAHNELNASGVLTFATLLGIPEEQVREALRQFPGVARRSDCLYRQNGVTIIDDYAHHPAEITATLEGLAGEERLVAVIQPHRHSRVKEHFGAFARAAKAADEVLVTDIYGLGEKVAPSISGEILAKSMGATYVPRERLAAALIPLIRPFDIVVFLGAGDITEVAYEVVEGVKRTPPRPWKMALLRGGESAEHEISHRSADVVKLKLDPALYEVTEFSIGRHGEWDGGFLSALQESEILFPLLHGPNGEDGLFAALSRLLHKPWIGCDHKVAAFCMDKAATKRLASAMRIEVLSYEMVSSPTASISIPFPVIVKPRSLGSSVAVSLVESAEGLPEAIAKVLEVDTHALIEEVAEGRELEFAAFGSEEITILPPGEIHSQGRIHTWEGKYEKESLTTTSARAELSPDLLAEGLRWAERVYRLFECEGLARIDAWLIGERFVLNEINSMPGMTKTSLYPEMCAANGVEMTDLLNKLSMLALQRARRGR